MNSSKLQYKLDLIKDELDRQKEIDFDKTEKAVVDLLNSFDHNFNENFDSFIYFLEKDSEELDNIRFACIIYDLCKSDPEITKDSFCEGYWWFDRETGRYSLIKTTAIEYLKDNLDVLLDIIDDISSYFEDGIKPLTSVLNLFGPILNKFDIGD